MIKRKTIILALFCTSVLCSQIREKVDDFATGVLCPNTTDGHLVAGNRHFDGPVNASLNIRMYIDASKTKIYYDVKLIEEAVNNDTKIEASWVNRLVYTAPEDFRIASFRRECGARNLQGNYISRICSSNDDGSDGQTYFFVLPESGGESKPFYYNDGKQVNKLGGRNSIVEHMSLIGDTGSEDVSDDRDCTHDSKILDIIFRGFEVNLVKPNNARPTLPNRIQLDVNNIKTPVHNRDCRRIQGRIIARAFNKKTGVEYPPENGNVLINWAGVKTRDFKVVDFNDLPKETVTFTSPFEKISVDNLRIVFEPVDLKRCHKSCDLCSGYNCNLRYSKSETSRLRLGKNAGNIDLLAGKHTIKVNFSLRPKI